MRSIKITEVVNGINGAEEVIAYEPITGDIGYEEIMA
jgi:hypothetical protein